MEIDMNNFYTKIKNDFDNKIDNINYENIFEEMSLLKIEIDSLKEQVIIFNQIVEIQDALVQINKTTYMQINSLQLQRNDQNNEF